jgi:hypothetical protein
MKKLIGTFLLSISVTVASVAANVSTDANNTPHQAKRGSKLFLQQKQKTTLGCISGISGGWMYICCDGVEGCILRPVPKIQL